MALAVNSLLARAFEGKEIRFVLDDHKEPWFVGKDVASALDYKRPNNVIAKKVDEEDKKPVHQISVATNLQPQTILVNKSAIIQLYANSKLPSAKRFKRWIFGEVIPSIMRTGSYEAPEEKKQELTEMDKLLAVEKERTNQAQINSAGKIKEITLHHENKVMEYADKEKDRIDRNLARAQELIPNDPQIIEATKIRAVSEAVPRFFEVSQTLFSLGLTHSQVRTMAPTVGRGLKKYWVETRHENPPQYMKYVNGDNRPVNHYPYECKDELDAEISELAKKK